MVSIARYVDKANRKSEETSFQNRQTTTECGTESCICESRETGRQRGEE